MGTFDPFHWIISSEFLYYIRNILLVGKVTAQPIVSEIMCQLFSYITNLLVPAL